MGAGGPLGIAPGTGWGPRGGHVARQLSRVLRLSRAHAQTNARRVLRAPHAPRTRRRWPDPPGDGSARRPSPERVPLHAVEGPTAFPKPETTVPGTLQEAGQVEVTAPQRGFRLLS